MGRNRLGVKKIGTFLLLWNSNQPLTIGSARAPCGTGSGSRCHARGSGCGGGERLVISVDSDVGGGYGGDGTRQTALITIILIINFYCKF